MSDMLRYKGYIGSVEYSEEDELLHGKLVGIRDLVSYDGMCLKSLRQCFEQSVDDYLEVCRAEGLVPNEPPVIIERQAGLAVAS